MIQLFRNQKIQKKIYLILAVAIIVSFAISGVLISNMDEDSSTSIAKIGNRDIRVQEYLNSYKALQHQGLMVYGETFNRLRPLLNLKGQAWDRILLLDYAKKQGIRASDKEVVDWISTQPFFLTKNGFDDRAYKLFLKEYLRTEPRLFEEEIRQMLTLGKIQDQFESSVKISDGELEELYIQKNGARDIEYVVLPWETEKNNASVTDEELKNLYPLFQNRLRDPDKAAIQYIVIGENASDEIKKALADTESSMDQIAAKHSLPLQQTSLFSRTENIPGLGLIPEILTEAFKLNEGEESGWIKVKSDSYKIKTVQKVLGSPLDFEKGKDQLREVVIKDKASQLAAQKLEELKKKIGLDDFSSIMKASGLDIQTAEKFKKGGYIPGIGPSQNIDQMISDLKEGEISGAIPVRNGAAMFKVLKNSALDRTDFDKNKEEFRKKSISEKAADQMDKLLDELKKNLKLNTEVLNKIFPEEEKES